MCDAYICVVFGIVYYVEVIDLAVLVRVQELSLVGLAV